MQTHNDARIVRNVEKQQLDGTPRFFRFILHRKNSTKIVTVLTSNQFSFRVFVAPAVANSIYRQTEKRIRQKKIHSKWILRRIFLTKKYFFFFRVVVVLR